MSQSKPIVWTIAGVDPSGAAGTYADMATFNDFRILAGAIATLLSVQTITEVHYLEFCKPDFIIKQVRALEKGLFPQAIKIGALGQMSTVIALYDFIKNYNGKIVFDPVLKSTSGTFLTEQKSYLAICKLLLPYINLFTPNVVEASKLLNIAIKNTEDMIFAANLFLQKGCKAVLIKGGHLASQYTHDYFTDGKNGFWINAHRFEYEVRGTGCRLSSAIAACLARGDQLSDAIVKAKLYLQATIRQSIPVKDNKRIMVSSDNSYRQSDLPWITSGATIKNHAMFPNCASEAIGLYPIVDSFDLVEYCLHRQATTIQLRIKNKPLTFVEQEIIRSIKLAKQFNARLFINDYWELAVKHKAYGVHLGQEDLALANLSVILHSGLRLGISTHSYYEIARAHAIRPSYIAFGPIYPTTSKEMNFSPRGLAQLKYWCQILDYPIVAIGGINLENYNAVLATGVNGIAFISATKHFFKDRSCSAI